MGREEEQVKLFKSLGKIEKYDVRGRFESTIMKGAESPQKGRS